MYLLILVEFLDYAFRKVEFLVFRKRAEFKYRNLDLGEYIALNHGLAVGEKFVR